MVALSVSISAMTSPMATGSPSFLCQVASVPSVMVGDNAGIRISIGIQVPPETGAAGSSSSAGPRACLSRWFGSGFDQDVSPKLLQIGFRALLGELGRVVDDAADFLVDPLQELLMHDVLFHQQLLYVVHRIQGM